MIWTFLRDQLPDPHDENLYKPINDYLKHHKRDYAAACGLRGRDGQCLP